MNSSRGPRGAHDPRNPITDEITLAAARLVVEEGFEYAAAKRRAARDLARHGGGRGGRAPELPANEAVEDAVREHIALFCAETQPLELAALRGVALTWMRRLAEFRPHLAGAVWRGTATRWSSVHLDLYCDDGKAAEIALINAGVAFELAPGSGPEEPVLTVNSPCRELGEPVTLHLHLLDHDALRGALKPDARGHTWRGDLAALERLLAAAEGPA
ncbi:MAG: hypothetical protein HZC37_20765 [Burkholderiales bacterium]|nr:hypothetical protein [Burkholderiales bacterium]